MNSPGFSLIEVVVTIGILSLLVSSAFLIGLPEYDRYILYSERDSLVSDLLESRVRSYVGGTAFTVSLWSNGYCIKDIYDTCVEPVHNLPTGMSVTSQIFATSTQIILSQNGSDSKNILQTSINIDQSGLIDGR